MAVNICSNPLRILLQANSGVVQLTAARYLLPRKSAPSMDIANFHSLEGFTFNSHIGERRAETQTETVDVLLKLNLICVSEKRTGMIMNINMHSKLKCYYPGQMIFSYYGTRSCRSFHMDFFNRSVNFMQRKTGENLKLLEQFPVYCQVYKHKSEGKKSSHLEDEDSGEENLADDDYEAPINFKKIQIYLKSLRADSVLSSGLNISRNRVDELFYESRLRLNGEKLLKKSKQVKEGDYVDLVMERTDDDQLLVKRVKVIHISPERTNKDKTAVVLKVWKGEFQVEDVSKSKWT